MIAFSTILFLVGEQIDLGFFWFAFIAGAFGASVAILRSIRQQPTYVQQTIADSWSLTLSPFLYGAVLAGLTYFLFYSGLLSGVDGEGLLMSNLFPDFARGDEATGGTTLDEFRSYTPKTSKDAGKLLVWCFLAGYSEEWVMNIIGNLQNQVGPPSS